MMQELALILVSVDGCSTGFVAYEGVPIYKPWTIAVSSVHPADQLSSFLCDQSQVHAWCEGKETAKSAFYPMGLCAAIHRGLDACEDQRRGGTVPAAAVAAAEAGT